MLIMDVHGAVFSNSDIVERVPQSIFFQHVSSRFSRTSRHDFDHIVFLHVIISPIHKRSSLYLYYNGIMIMYWPNTVEHHPSCGHGHIFDGSHLDDCGSGVRQVVVVVVLQVFVVAGRETFQIIGRFFATTPSSRALKLHCEKKEISQTLFYVNSRCLFDKMFLIWANS